MAFITNYNSNDFFIVQNGEEENIKKKIIRNSRVLL